MHGMREESRPVGTAHAFSSFQIFADRADRRLAVMTRQARVTTQAGQIVSFRLGHGGAVEQD